MSKISVAIPTFNRPNAIHRRILELNGFCHIVSELWISDNSLDHETELVCSRAESNVKIIYSRNSENIGGGANFLKSLTIGDADYVWLRGDDDPITASQVNSLVASLSTDPDAVILSQFCTHQVRLTGIYDYFYYFSYAQSSGWMSMLAYKQVALLRSLKWGYWGIYSGWSNITLLLGILRDTPSCLCIIQPVEISCSDFREDGRSARKWSVLKTCVDSFPIVFNIIPTAKQRRFAYYQWRKTQNFNIVRSYLRSRLGLAVEESVTCATLANLFSIKNPRSFLIALTLLLVSITPNILMAACFSLACEFVSESSMSSLEFDMLSGLDVVQRFKKIRSLQNSRETSGNFI